MRGGRGPHHRRSEVTCKEAALGHGASGTVEVANPPWCMMGLPFVSMPLATERLTEGADDTCFGGMGAGGAADDRRENAEALVRCWCGSVWVAVDKVKVVVSGCLLRRKNRCWHPGADVPG